MKATSKKSVATSTRIANAKKNVKMSSKQKKAIERHRLDPQLKIVPVVKENPRRKGSFGFKSMQVILKARKPITIEEFTTKGGRLRDLHWDIAFGNVKVKGQAA
jgi:hypothetical protein